MSSIDKILSKPQRFLVRPASGWSDLALAETTHILLNPTQKYKFAPTAVIEEGIIVVSECDYRQALELTARLTSAHDVEWVAQSGRVSSRGDWPEFFAKALIQEVFNADEKSKVHVAADVSHPVVGTSKELRSLAQKAWGLAETQIESNASADADDRASEIKHRIRIDCAKNRTRVLVSMGGQPLYKRGYKSSGMTATAPLPENHAANCFAWAIGKLGDEIGEAILTGRTFLAVPFAGSGTTGFESVNRLIDISPCLTRSVFSCEAFTFHPVATMASIRKRLLASVKNQKINLVFGDVNQDVLEGLNSQITSFVAATHLDLHPRACNNDFLSDPLKLIEFGKSKEIDFSGVFLPMNPPYGQRLAKLSGSVAIYDRLGMALNHLVQNNSQSLKSLSGYVICPDEESWSALSKRLNRFKMFTRHFTHGGNDTRLLVFASN